MAWQPRGSGTPLYERPRPAHPNCTLRVRPLAPPFGNTNGRGSWIKPEGQDWRGVMAGDRIAPACRMDFPHRFRRTRSGVGQAPPPFVASEEDGRARRSNASKKSNVYCRSIKYLSKTVVSCFLRIAPAQVKTTATGSGRGPPALGTEGRPR